MDRLLRRAPLVALLLYAALAIFYTRPLLLHITNAVAGGGTDGWNNYWNFWWTPFALLNLHQSPFRTNWIFYQSGTNLYFHTLQPLNGLISAPFQLFGVAFAENILTLLSYLLTAFATYLLARLLLQNYIATQQQGVINHAPTNPTSVGAQFIVPTVDDLNEGVIYHAPAVDGEQGVINHAPTDDGEQGVINHAPTVDGEQGVINHAPTGQHSALSTQHSALTEAAAFLAGFAFTYASPWRLQYLYGGQVNRLSIEWLPLFLYFVYRTYLHRTWRDAIFAALCIVAAALTELQYVVYMAIFAVILLLVELVVKGWRAWLPPALRVIGAGGLALLILSPLLYVMLKELASDPSLAPLPGATIFHSADLLELFAPNRTNLLWGGLADHLNLSVYSKYLAFGAFSPPYIIILLAIAGLILAWRWLQTRVLVVNLITFLLISLGPLLHINGKETYTQFGGNILMPYSILYYLPFMKVSRDPERFGEMAFLCWSLLAALGSFIIAQRYLRRSAPAGGSGSTAQQRRWLVAGGFALVLLLAGIEFVKVTPPITPVNTPPFYQQLGKDNERYAILELPFYKSGDEDQWFSYQAVHHKYLFGGNLARKQTHSFIEDTPVLNWFAAEQPPAPDIVPTPPLAVAFDVLRWANVRYVALIKQPVAEQNLSGERALIKTVWGANTSPVYSDSIMDVYQVPTTTLTGTATISPMLAISRGWYTFEADAHGGHRWVSGDGYNTDGYLTILSLGAVGNYTLTFRAFSYAAPQQVQVKYQGRILTTVTITPAEQSFNIPLAIVPDRSEIILHFLGQPISPKASGAGDDPRLLSVGFGNFSLRQ